MVLGSWMVLSVFCSWASQKTLGSWERAREQTRDPSSAPLDRCPSPLRRPAWRRPSSSVVVCRRWRGLEATSVAVGSLSSSAARRVAVPEAPGAAQASSLELASLHLCPLDGLLGYAPLRTLSPLSSHSPPRPDPLSLVRPKTDLISTIAIVRSPPEPTCANRSEPEPTSAHQSGVYESGSENRSGRPFKSFLGARALTLLTLNHAS